jgi:signal transduction histidine kinase
MIYSNGEVIGVLRYVTSTKIVDRQIIYVAAVSVLALLVILGITVLASNYFIRSIMTPVQQITEMARRIANGSYGVQIRTPYADEIGELADTINELSTKISQNEKMQAEFISQLSHELRTPLTVINGWTETLLADESMDAETRQGLKIVSSEAGRLTEMVVELLDFTRMQDGRMTLNVETTDIRGEFEDTVFMYGSRLAQDGIRLEYLDSDDDIPEIPCDPKRLRQVFLNILDNAAKHGGAGGQIEASMRLENEQVVVRIRDFGPGIPEDELPLVKKKFYKGSSSVRGTGIGLAVCDEIVEMHGGELLLANAAGGGTEVTVRLPAAQ